MKRKHRRYQYGAQLLLYLALSALTSAFWTWIVRLILPDMPLWASGIVFLLIFLLAFEALACIGVGTSRNLPAVRRDKP